MIEPNLQESYFQTGGQPTIAGIKLLSDFLTRLSTAESDIVDLAAQVASELAVITADIASANVTISALQSENIAQQAEIDALEAKFAAIAAIANPAGGATVDSQARSAITNILAAA